MSLLLILMVFGLLGLGVMGLPGLFHHGHPGHTLHPGHSPSALGAGSRGGGLTPSWAPQWLPGPRVLFSLSALVGAFGNAAQHWLHLTTGIAALSGFVPALLVEVWVVRRVWNLGLRFQGQPSGSLEALVLERAHAVTAFRNGRGMVRVEREGRVVQFVATLVPTQAEVVVKVGDPLRIESIDSLRERVTVSVL